MFSCMDMVSSRCLHQSLSSRSRGSAITVSRSDLSLSLYNVAAISSLTARILRSDSCSARSGNCLRRERIETRASGILVSSRRLFNSGLIAIASGGQHCRGEESKLEREVEPGAMVAVKLNLTPPRAKKVRHDTEHFGTVSSDDYFWLRDDARKDPEVLAYLNAENEYTDAVMADTKDFQAGIYQELRGRIQEDDMSVPYRRGSYFYYTRDLKGMQYSVHCRRAIVDGKGPGYVEEVMATGDGAPEEEILLDENELAAKHEFYMVESVKISPNHKMFAVAEDFIGNEIYTVRVQDLESAQDVDKITGTTGDIVWGDNETLFYLSQDETLRPFKVWHHKLGSDQAEDTCIYHEEDVEFWLGLDSSESQEYILVLSGSKTTQFVLYLKCSEPHGDLQHLTERIEGVDTSVTHRGDHFFITRRTDEFYNSELLACPVDDPFATTVVLAHRPSVKLQEVQVLRDHLVTYERLNGLVTVTIYSLPPLGEPLTNLGEGRKIEFPEPTYSVWRGKTQYESSILRYHYSSLCTPSSVYDYDLKTGKSVLKKLEQVLGGFDKAKYETQRKWAKASDGTLIPISLVFRKDLVKLDGTDPLWLYGYGSYEIPIDVRFDSKKLSMLDRGFVLAIAHIRGGGEMGRQWYENGKLMHKKNTFTDFITCAEFLLEEKYGAKNKLCIQGRSAGGLLIGAVTTMRPDLFTVAVAEVAFVDVVSTMLDASIPLTTAEWEEWGNPAVEADYLYMISYSPVDNVKSANYPNMLITGGLHDPRVGYWEPAKFTAKLREKKTDNNLLIFKCDMSAGHFSKSGRFDKLEETALVLTFILKCVGLTPAA